MYVNLITIILISFRSFSLIFRRFSRITKNRRALCPGRVRSCHHPSSHVPGCSFCSFYSFLSIPGAIGSKSVLPDGSSADGRRLPGAFPLWVATFCTLKKRRVLPFDLHLGRARTDQGRQHTHHGAQLIVSWLNFSPHALFL